MELNPESYMLPCLTRQYLGFDCPGCGFQRSLVYLFSGEFAQAFVLYPPIYTFATLTGSLVLFLAKRNTFTQRLAIVSGVAHGIVTLAAYIYKIL